MKQIILPALLALATWIAANDAQAQKKARNEITKRCGSKERVEAIFRFHPELRNLPNLRRPSTNNNYRLQATVTIPVVVHIILPNPWLVTDADVQGQIDRLNLDYSGLNPDSTNATNFMSLRGHSQIQFCLARRTPGGQLTNGIERLASSTGSNINLSQDPIKHGANGGLDVWDPNAYLNLWVGVDNSGLGILGYAQFPGTTPANEDGVFLNYQSFGSSACYTISAFNKGRTGTHEVGHYLGLFHIWGDESGCTGDDFDNLTAAGSSVSLPANLANGPGQGNTGTDIGDTPNQADATSGCLTGTRTDACSNVAPGFMYQDYMDYTDDACYSMFTKKQVERMEWVINNARSSLTTSLGCQPPASAVSLDAMPFQSVNPGGMEVNGCAVVSYPSSFGCASSVQPKLRIKNNGLTTMTSVTAGYRYDNGAAVSNSFSVSIPVGGTAVVTLPSLSLTAGNHTLKFYTFNPNGAADQTPANDTLVQNLTVAGSVSLPVTEQFTSTTFPPTGWTISNPNSGSITWTRWTGTLPTGTPYSSPASAWVDIYSYNNPGQQDFLWSPSVVVSEPADSVIVTFRVAHQTYTGADDTLEVVYSANCGVTWQRLNSYYKWSSGSGSNALATVTPSCTCDFAPASTAQWRQERIGLLPSNIGSPANLMIGWKSTTDYGNNIFIDDIIVFAKSVYTFTGTGNWSVASNWLNNRVPPAVLPFGSEIIIDPASGNSVKDMPVTLSPGSKLTVMPGKTLMVP